MNIYDHNLCPSSSSSPFLSRSEGIVSSTHNRKYLHNSFTAFSIKIKLWSTRWSSICNNGNTSFDLTITTVLSSRDIFEYYTKTRQLLSDGLCNLRWIIIQNTLPVTTLPKCRTLYPLREDKRRSRDTSGAHTPLDRMYQVYSGIFWKIRDFL